MLDTSHTQEHERQASHSNTTQSYQLCTDNTRCSVRASLAHILISDKWGYSTDLLQTTWGKQGKNTLWSQPDLPMHSSSQGVLLISFSMLIVMSLQNISGSDPRVAFVEVELIVLNSPLGRAKNAVLHFTKPCFKIITEIRRVYQRTLVFYFG